MQLKPVLGPIQLIFYSVGVIIGAGVYSVIGNAAGLAGEGVWLSFVIGALVALLTGFSYAEMTTAFPQAGAEYVYLRRALPRHQIAAFGIGILMIVGAAATASTVAVAFGGYLRQFIDMPVPVSAFLLLAACTALNIWGLHQSSWTNILFTSIEICGLLLVIAAGFWGAEPATVLLTPPDAGVMPAAAIIFFVYLGFEEIANMTEEVRDPARDLPRAIFYSIAITTLLYVLVSLAAVALVPPGDLAASDAPLALAVQKVWPESGAALSAIALFATANTVLLTVIAASRLVFSMGRDGEIPIVFGRLHTGRQTPWAAAVLVFVVSIALLPIGSLKVLAELSSFAALVAFLSVNVALIILRYRMPRHPRPFRVPLQIGRMPILPLAAIGSIGLLLGFFDWQIYTLGVVAMGLIVVAFFIRQGWKAGRQER